MTRAALGSLALYCLALSGCHGATSPARPAQLELDRERVELGNVKTHDTLGSSFRVHNTGGAVLSVAVEAGHECTSAESSLRVAPGASAALSVSCRPEQHGAFLSTLTLTSNDPARTRVVLELAAQVTPLLAWDRPLLAFTLPFAEERRELLTLVGVRAREAKLSEPTAPDPALTLEPRPGPEGDALAVTAHGTAVGFHSGELVVQTGLDDPRELRLPFSCQVTGTLTVDPSNPYFDLLAPHGQRVILTAHSVQPGFRLLGVDVLDGPFKASFSGRPGQSYQIDLSFLPAHAVPDARGALGHVRLRSTDRSEPDKTLDLLAFGAPNAER